MWDINWDIIRKILIFAVFVIAFEKISTEICSNMKSDSNVVIRFLGYAIAFILAIVTFWLVFYYCFDINLLEGIRNLMA